MKSEHWVTREVYEDAYRRICRRRGMRGGLAREALHDAVAEALRRPAPPSGVRFPALYLAQLARWRAASARRRAKADARLREAASALPRETRASSPEDVVAGSMILQRLDPRHANWLVDAALSEGSCSTTQRVRAMRARRSLETLV